MYRISIKMLDVKDGDAIIIHITRNDDAVLVLVDGGHVGDGELVLAELEKSRADLKKGGPDLVVCTHYDNDHIGGLSHIIQHYGNNIGQVWMHDTSAVLEITETAKPAKRSSASSIFPSEDDVYIKTDELTAVLQSDEGQQVLRTLKQEGELLQMIKEIGIPHTEPVAGECKLEGWPEIVVLGPTREYYEKLFPKKIDKRRFVEEEAEGLRADIIELTADKDVPADPCEALNKADKQSISPTNLNSAIILINIEETRFLFTGDSGVESFRNIPNYEDLLTGIFWLKVPHHGSIKNMNSELIGIINPSHAYISGDKRISPSIVGCLKAKGTAVELTRGKGHLLFEQEFDVK